MSRAKAASLDDSKVKLPPASSLETTTLAQPGVLQPSALGANGAVVLGGRESVVSILSLNTIILMTFVPAPVAG